MKEVDQILLDLKRKIYKPVYFLCGEEPYYIDQISDYIEDNVLEDLDKEFNQYIVYGKDIDLTGIVGLARQFPMSGERTVVIVKEAQNIKELNKKEKEEENKDKDEPPGLIHFKNYLESPQESTILVMCYKYKTPDKRSAWVKSLQKKSVFVQTKGLYDNKIPDWIAGIVKEKKYTISPKASHILAEFLGTDLSKIVNEINKLIIQLPEGSEITVDLIQDKIGISKDFNVFELQEAFTNKDILKANRIIQYFAANEKENPSPVVLANLFSYFSKVLKYHFLPNKNKFVVAEALGVPPFFADSYAKAAAAYPSAKLKHIFAHLKECDLKTKGVNNYSIGYGELLKELVYKIMH